MRINVGCGHTATPSWMNFDNSLALRLAKIPLLPELLKAFRLIDTPQYQFILFAQSNQVKYGDATKRLLVADASVEVLYSSHMFEHLDRTEASSFLKEARRVLKPGGIIRLAVPDIERQVHEYLKHGDADAFIEGTYLAQPQPRTFLQRVRLLIVGARHHQWMYDGKSLCCLLSSHGFINAVVVSAGATKIANPAPLDLFERLSESVYVEAENPGKA